MLDQTYHIKLADALRGRRVPEGIGPAFQFLGAQAGIPPGDIHHERLYQIWLDLDETRRITAVATAVTGELISPCSGYAQESLDEFDFQSVLDWCLVRTKP